MPLCAQTLLGFTPPSPLPYSCILGGYPIHTDNVANISILIWEGGRGEGGNCTTPSADLFSRRSGKFAFVFRYLGYSLVGLVTRKSYPVVFFASYNRGMFLG